MNIQKIVQFSISQKVILVVIAIEVLLLDGNMEKMQFLNYLVEMKLKWQIIISSIKINRE